MWNPERIWFEIIVQRFVTKNTNKIWCFTCMHVAYKSHSIRSNYNVNVAAAKIRASAKVGLCNFRITGVLFFLAFHIDRGFHLVVTIGRKISRPAGETAAAAFAEVVWQHIQSQRKRNRFLPWIHVPLGKQRFRFSPITPACDIDFRKCFWIWYTTRWQVAHLITDRYYIFIRRHPLAFVI